MTEEKQKPLTREDVLKAIEENGGKAEGLDLSNRRFVEPIDLSDVDLSGIKLINTHLFRANFNGSNLDRAIIQKAYLGYATFNPLNSKGASLQGVDLRWANLHDAEFRGADLTAAQFQETPVQAVVHPPELQGKLLELLPASLERTDFRGSNLFRANFKGCYFYGTKLEGAYIRGADILEAHLEEADWGNYIIGEENKKDFYSAVHYYRRLKTWYTTSGISDTAANFYYREKEANRKALKWCSKSSFRHRLALEIIRGTFGYGERWWNVLYWIAALILLFTFTYLAILATWEWWQIIPSWVIGLIVLFACINSAMSLTWVSWKRFPVWLMGLVLLFCAGYFIGESVSNARLFGNALYFSAVSFTALGYGEWVNLNNDLTSDIIRGFGAFESLVGISMMALLLVTFFRKWTR